MLKLPHKWVKHAQKEYINLNQRETIGLIVYIVIWLQYFTY